jgi:hypothetical protein
VLQTAERPETLRENQQWTLSGYFHVPWSVILARRGMGWEGGRGGREGGRDEGMEGGKEGGRGEGGRELLKMFLCPLSQMPDGSPVRRSGGLSFCAIRQCFGTAWGKMRVALQRRWLSAPSYTIRMRPIRAPGRPRRSLSHIPPCRTAGKGPSVRATETRTRQRCSRGRAGSCRYVRMFGSLGGSWTMWTFHKRRRFSRGRRLE